MKPQKKKKSKKYLWTVLIAVVAAVVCFSVFSKNDNSTAAEQTSAQSQSSSQSSQISSTSTDSVEPVETISVDSIPEYSGEPFTAVNNNEPTFDKNKKPIAFETYSKLDSLGRCGTAFACVCRETMPTSKREDIGSVKPTGWMHVDYDFVDGGSLYNRCHLIGFQLTAENANERNLITGTRYMNTEGMLPFENMVADYVKETNNHVLYCVKPIFKGSELVARGVQMQAYSIEDNGEGVCFNVFCYNVQPGVNINYQNGENSLAEGAQSVKSSSNAAQTTTTTSRTTYNAAASDADYILNIRSHKFHYPNCSGVQDMSPKNREEFKGSRQELIDQGYKPCGNCNP